MISAFGISHDGEISKGIVENYKRRKTLVQAQQRMQRDPAYKQEVLNQIGAAKVRRQLANNPAFRQTGPRSFESVKKLRGEEFNPSSPYEKYSSEKKRRRVAVEGAAYGGLAATAGVGGTVAANAKFAGTRTGQGLIRAQKAGKNHPLTPHLKTAGEVGRYAAKNKGKMTGALIGASAVSGAAGVAARFRRNEEAGMSQGIGRIKAGTTYTKDQRKITKSFTPWTAAATLADVNWQNPAIKRSLNVANKHKKKLAAGAVGGTAVGVGAGTVKGAKNRRRDAAQLRRIQ